MKIVALLAIALLIGCQSPSEPEPQQQPQQQEEEQYYLDGMWLLSVGEEYFSWYESGLHEEYVYNKYDMKLMMKTTSKTRTHIDSDVKSIFDLQEFSFCQFSRDMLSWYNYDATGTNISFDSNEPYVYTDDEFRFMLDSSDPYTATFLDSNTVVFANYDLNEMTLTDSELSAYKEYESLTFVRYNVDGDTTPVEDTGTGTDTTGVETDTTGTFSDTTGVETDPTITDTTITDTTLTDTTITDTSLTDTTLTDTTGTGSDTTGTGKDKGILINIPLNGYVKNHFGEFTSSEVYLYKDSDTTLPCMDSTSSHSNTGEFEFTVGSGYYSIKIETAISYMFIDSIAISDNDVLFPLGNIFLKPNPF